MGIQQPGVSVSPNTFAVQQQITESAVPLFIGFTETQPATLPAYVSTFADYENLFGGPDPDAGGSVLYYAVRHFFDNGGQGGFIYSQGTYAAFQPQPKTFILLSDIFALTNAIAAEQSITLLAYPDSVLIPDDDAGQWQTYWQEMLKLCQVRSGLFAVLDAPDSPVHAKDTLASFNTPYGEWGGIWWPRLVTPYLEDNNPVTVPPSGAVLAAMQQTDGTRGVWSAPANIVLAQVTRPVYSWLEAEELFNPDGRSLNLIRSFPGRGTRIWGCRTLTSDDQSSFRYVQTRRVMSWCETNISNLARMFVFEPNAELTWYKLKGFTIMWLRELWQQGGLYGEQEPQAYQILLGLDETMTQEDILAGKMIMNIRLALLAPAEFIELNLVFMMNGENGA